ncbi:protein kinase [Clostridia bacterium OttesenSCG-928-F22]|nr:protein kinase [Clostridia bacterium OttesenSCG-928-F22]
MIEKLESIFEILETVGSGGMAIVYKAINRKTKKTVALKVLKEEFSTDVDYLRRFEKEGKALSEFSHKNIVNVYSVGNIEGAAYIEMEYVEGQTLKEYIKEHGMLDVQEAVDICVQMCEALEHAHSKNIIHRDVKSQNILLLNDGRAKLADFGIARDASSSTVTFAGGDILGSVHYLSPEQARGEVVTEKTDIYSLGIVFYEMLTGTLPFSGDNTITVALKHLNEEITPPIEMIPTLRRSLSKVVMQATQKEQVDRYDSMRIFKRELLKAYTAADDIPQEEDTEESFEPEQDKPKKVKDVAYKKTFRLLVGAIFLVVILFSFFFIGSAISRNTSRTGQVFAPELIGKTLSEAQALANRAGFTLDVVRKPSAETEDTILDQFPNAGELMLESGVVTIDVSDGSQITTMPKLTGLSLHEAIELIESHGLEIGEKYTEMSDLPDGTVVRQSPEQGSSIQLGQPVDIWMSGVPEYLSIKAPDIIGKKITDDIKTLLREEEIYLGFIREQQSDKEAGSILETQPAAGAPINRFDKLDVTISAYEKKYSAELMVILDISKNDSNVVATVMQFDGVEIVAYEETVAAGQRQINLKLTSHTETEKTLLVYVNGNLELSREIAFKAEGSAS